MSKTDRQCDDCQFWNELRGDVQMGDQYGHCRFNPPLPVGHDGVIWPRTRSDHWCGKWEQRDGKHNNYTGSK